MRRYLTPRHHLRPSSHLVFLVAFFNVSCGAVPAGPPTVASIVLAPQTATLTSLGATTRLAASVLDQHGNLISGRSINWNSTDAKVATVENGVVTAVADGQVTITAEVDGVTGSATVEVLQEPAQLTMLDAPPYGVAGVPFSPQLRIAIVDAGGHPVVRSTAAVSVEIGVNPTTTTILGNTTVNATGGVVAFADLAIDLAGREYSLIISAEGLSDLTIRRFDVYSGLPATQVGLEAPGVLISELGSAFDIGIIADDVNDDPALPPAMTWRSHNEKVATVEPLGNVQGRATAHRDGQVTISIEGSGFAANMLITVSDPDFPGARNWRWGDFNANQYQAIWETSPDDVWIVGNGGTILHYDGTAWSDVSPQLTSKQLQGVWASGPSDAWAVGLEGTVLHYDGSEWRSVDGFDTDHWFHDIWGSGPQDVWLVGTNSSDPSVMHYDGSTWTEMAGSLPGENLREMRRIWGSGPDAVWVGGFRGNVFRWDGLTWDLVEDAVVPSRVHDIFGSSAADVWVLGDPWVYHYDGTQWVNRTADVQVIGGNPRSGWASAAGGAYILASNTNLVAHFDGASWSTSPIPWTFASTPALAGMGSNDLWAVTWVSEIAHYDGARWFNATPRTTVQNTRGVWGSSPGNMWAVGDLGEILHDDGTGWTRMVSPTMLGLWEVWGSAPQDVWAVGHQGTIIHFDGVAWSLVSHGLTTTHLRGIWGSGPGDVWVVGGAETVLRFDGEQWTTVTLPFATTSLTSVWGSSASDVWVVGGNGPEGVVLQYDGEQWRDRTPHGTGLLNDVWSISPAAVWVVGPGEIRFFDGTDWTDQRGELATESLDALWGTGPSDVWAVGSGVFVFDGATWRRVNTEFVEQDLLATWGTRTSPVQAWGARGTLVTGTR